MFTLEDEITIEIPITEEDLRQMKEDILRENKVIDWIFPTNTGKEFRILLMSEDEYKQRRK